jgi:hypothetical protein
MAFHHAVSLTGLIHRYARWNGDDVAVYGTRITCPAAGGCVDLTPASELLFTSKGMGKIVQNRQQYHI